MLNTDELFAKFTKVNKGIPVRTHASATITSSPLASGRPGWVPFCYSELFFEYLFATQIQLACLR